MLKSEDWHFWQTRSDAIILDNSVPADCLEKVVDVKTEEIQYQKIHLSPRLPRRIVVKSAWQVQKEGQVQHEGSTGEPAEIDFRIQGISRAEVEQDEEKSRKHYLGRLVSAIMNHKKENALIAELQCKHPFTPFSEESKQMIHTLGKVEGFELCEISPKISMSSSCEILDRRNCSL